MRRPVVTIITVVYNGADTLQETIDSVAGQRYKDLEYIIVDGGSHDGTIDIIKRNQATISNWISERDQGVYDAMNKGIKMATGDRIFFLGADDVLYNGEVIEKVVQEFRRNNELIYGDVLMKSTGKRYDGRFSRLKLTIRNIAHQSLFYPRAVFEKYQFSLLYRIFADYHLNMILFNQNSWSFRHIPLIVSVFDDGGMSGSLQRDLAFEKDNHELIRQNFPAPYYWYRVIRTKAKNLLSKKRE